jgi:hypothetical protein
MPKDQVTFSLYVNATLAEELSKVLMRDEHHLRYDLITSLATLAMTINGTIEAVDLTEEQRCMVHSDITNFLISCHDPLCHPEDDDEESEGETLQ